MSLLQGSGRNSVDASRRPVARAGSDAATDVAHSGSLSSETERRGPSVLVLASHYPGWTPPLRGLARSYLFVTPLAYSPEYGVMAAFGLKSLGRKRQQSSRPSPALPTTPESADEAAVPISANCRLRG